MFFLEYIGSELRRRKGRTFLTALGLALGVGLVVTVAALSDGLDKAQDKVLEPLTGVGTDMSVYAPARDRPERERRASGGPGFDFGSVSLGAAPATARERPGPPEPGPISASRARSSRAPTSPRDRSCASRRTRTDKVAGARRREHCGGRPDPERRHGLRHGAEGGPAAGRLSRAPGGPAATGGADRPTTSTSTRSASAASTSPTASLGAVTAGQVTKGACFSAGDAREAILNRATRRRKGLAIGDKVTLGGKRFNVVGLASPPLGGQASDVYVKLGQLQTLSDRKGRVNTCTCGPTAPTTSPRSRQADRGGASPARETTTARTSPTASAARSRTPRTSPASSARRSTVVGAAGGVPDRQPADALLGDQAHPRARHAQGDRLAAAHGRAPGDRRVAGPGRARRRAGRADRRRRRGADHARSAPS